MAPDEKKEDEADEAKADEAKEGKTKAEEAKNGNGKPQGSQPPPRPTTPRSGKPGVDPLDAVVQLMQKQEFGKASIELEKMLKKEPEDPVLLHNLGVVYTEQERFAEAEETFMSAFEAQKKLNKYNYATLFGLATVLTEQGGQGKLLQAEALFRDCLMKAIAEEEKGVFETYRTFTSLAENLGLQKRWKDATEAYEQAYELGYRMFGKDHERTVAQGAMMVRAKKLAKMQKWMRGGLWCATAAVPIFCAWMWRWSGAPSMSEIFLMSTGQSNASATNAAGAMMG